MLAIASPARADDIRIALEPVVEKGRVPPVS
jgi:hypothetical protein